MRNINFKFQINLCELQLDYLIPNCLLLKLVTQTQKWIKEIPNGFPCLNNVIQTRGMLRDFRKA